MLSDMLFNQTQLPVIRGSLDAAMLRVRTVSNNIANINTPGYRRSEVSFESELRDALNRNRLQGAQTQEGHLPLGRQEVGGLGPKVYMPIDPTQPSGVNNVDIDAEMAKLAEAQIQYNYAVKFGQGIYRKLNSAIQAKSLPVQ